jgi:anti-sigma-K factor RskA
METGIHELTAGYALDSLEDDERRAYEEHLDDCPRCQEELASFWEVTGALALAATGPEPPPELRGRILESVRAEGKEELQNVVPLRPRRRFGPPQILGAVAAIAAVALIAVGWWAISLHSRLADTRSALSDQRTVGLVLADSAAHRAPLAAGTGSLVSGTGGSVLVVDGLSPAPSGKTYQVWVVRKGTPPISSGLFAGGGHSVVLVEHPVTTGDVVAVTLEHAGGAKAPTSAPVAASHPL